MDLQSAERLGTNHEEIRWEEARKVVEAMNKALARVHEQYGDINAPYQEYLDYHNEHHTEAVIRRTRRIIGALRDAGIMLSREEKGLVIIAAAFHDSVQTWYPALDTSSQYPVVKRVRLAGFNPDGNTDTDKGNEYLSAQEAIECLKELGIHSQAYEEKINEIIKCTVSKWSEEYETINQEFLSKDSSPIAWVVALADMGNLGMETADIFLKEGDALFREEYLFIKTYLQEREEPNKALEDIAVDAMQNWSVGQIKFAERRKELVLKRIEEMPVSDEGKEAVRSLFIHFDEAIEEAKKAAEKRSSMTFNELVHDMGYKV